MTSLINSVILGDCLEVMQAIPDKSIDLILTDPPYGTTACKWDCVIPFEPMWKQVNRVIKDNGAVLLFGSEPFSSLLRCSNLKQFKYDWVWKKSNPSNIALAKKQPMKYHEIISVFNSKIYYPEMIERKSNRIKKAHKNNYKFINRGSEQTQLNIFEVDSIKYLADKKNPSSVLEFNSLRPNGKEFVKHPTQKPVKLLEYLIKTYTQEGETVLDFTCGSGSTLVAAKNLNRKYIGIEKEQKYYEICLERLKQ